MLAALSVGATVIAILIAFRSQREAQSAIFPIVREQESTRAQRARLSIFVWIAITALFLGGWLATLRLEASDPAVVSVASEATPAEVVVQEPEPTSEPTLPVVEPSPTPQIEVQSLTSAETSTTIASTSTLEPSSTFTLTPLPPTATSTNTPVPPTATPTSTPTMVPPTTTPTPVGAIQIPSPVPRTPAPSEARIGPIQFAEDVTPDIQAVNPGDVFPNGIDAVYAIYPFSGMQRGLDFTVVWYRNGVEVAREETEWPYGERATSYSFLVPRGEGLYKLELLVNDTIMASGLFEVR